jgi:hypothetical protein
MTFPMPIEIAKPLLQILGKAAKRANGEPPVPDSGDDVPPAAVR